MLVNPTTTPSYLQYYNILQKGMGSLDTSEYNHLRESPPSRPHQNEIH